MVVLAWRLMPATEIPALKKSKMLLLSMMLPVLLFGLADPSDMKPLLGRLAPAGPMSLFEMVLPLLAPPVDVLIRMLPLAVVTRRVDEPSTVQFVIILLCAPLMRRIVLVPAVADVLAFEIVSELPAEFRPLIVTLSAPCKVDERSRKAAANCSCAIRT